MRDKLDGLRHIMVKLSRVPGLGFLERQGDSLTMLKHRVEAHISSLEAKKQGLEDGAEVVRDTFRRKSKDTDAGGKPVAAGTKAVGGGREGDDSAADQEQQLAGKLGAARRQTDGKRVTTPPAEIRSQKKQLMRKLKR